MPIQAAANGALSAAERSHPMSKVRGGGREEIPHTHKQEARGSGQ